MRPEHRPRIINNLERHGRMRDPMNEGGYRGTRVFTILFETKTYLAEGPPDGTVATVIGRVLPKPASLRSAGEGQCLYRHEGYTYLLEKLDAGAAQLIRDGWNGARNPGPARI